MLQPVRTKYRKPSKAEYMATLQEVKLNYGQFILKLQTERIIGKQIEAAGQH